MNNPSRRDVLTAGLTLGAAALTGRLSGTSIESTAAQTTPTRVGGRTLAEFFQTFTTEWVRQNPDLAAGARYFSGTEQERLERQLTPQTLAWRRDRIARARRGLADLRAFDRAAMTELDRVSADVMDWQLDIITREQPFLDYTFPLQQFNGANVNLVETLTVRRPLANERDAENYVTALAQVAARLGETIEEARRLEALKILPPRFILTATVKQMRAFVGVPGRENPFVAVFADRIASVPSIPDSKRAQLVGEAEKVVVSRIYPTWKDAIELLQAQITRASDDAGLWRFKVGADAYAYALERFTTTKLTANEIHEIGLREVARIEGEIDGLLRQLGRVDGPVKQRVEQLKRDRQYPQPTSEESRAQIMRDIDAIMRDAEQRAALLFDRRPKSPVVARPFPTFRESNAAANYNAPAPDGSRPGTFQYPRRVENMTRFNLRSIVYHETVPGHHFQIALQVENADLPRFRQIGALGGAAASTEGWGLYAERLAAESGWYADDVEGRIGQLDSELFRARRLVVDTGLHAKKWTRQQAIDFGIEASEIERYVVNPGQACAYMIGELKILELRDKARSALGDRFSLRDFHNIVLATGVVPLDVLGGAVDRYIAATQRNNR